MPPAVAVSVAVWFVVTLAIVAVNDALIAPDGTVTLEGTETVEVLLERETTKPDEAAAPLRFTRQESVPAPVIDCELHASPPRTGTPVPLTLIVVEPCAELLERVTEPVNELELPA